MRAAKRNVRRVLRSVKSRFARLRGRGQVERLKDVEAAQDVLMQELAALRAEVQMGSMRQQALVDYYETRIDRIYARLSADLAGSGGVSLTVQQDSELDDRLMEDFRKVLRTRNDYVSIPIAEVLSDRLSVGVIKGPLTLQGFRINRAVAREMGDRVRVAGVDRGRAPVALYGPYKKLDQGRYEIVLSLIFRGKSGKDDPGVLFDIYCPSLNRMLTEGAARPGKGAAEENAEVRLDLDWSEAPVDAELEFRVHQRSSREVEIIEFEIKKVGN